MVPEEELIAYGLWLIAIPENLENHNSSFVKRRSQGRRTDDRAQEPMADSERETGSWQITDGRGAA